MFMEEWKGHGARAAACDMYPSAEELDRHPSADDFFQRSKLLAEGK
jgi:hypothetical protein